VLVLKLQGEVKPKGKLQVEWIKHQFPFFFLFKHESVSPSPPYRYSRAVLPAKESL
jgi:hypothetical protein